LGGDLLVSGVQLAGTGFDHIPAGGYQATVTRHQTARPEVSVQPLAGSPETDAAADASGVAATASL
jgi:hypothetical protein